MENSSPIEQWKRQEGLLPHVAIERTSVTLVGAGGLGSFAALALAKMGVPRLRVYDVDTVELHNVSNQLYGQCHIGGDKVFALKEVLSSLSDDVQVNAIPRHVTEEDRFLTPIVVSCVDSMASRKVIWEAVKASPAVAYYIDMRAGAEALMFLTVMMEDQDAQAKYESETLYSDEEAVEGPCTARAIIYTAFFAAGIIAMEVKRWLIGERSMYAGMTEKSFHCPSLESLTS